MNLKINPAPASDKMSFETKYISFNNTALPPSNLFRRDFFLNV
jgi:hypothetical protein